MRLKLFLFSILFLVFVVAKAQKPERIVSLAPSLTKAIYQLGAGEMLVGCTSFCTEALNDDVEVVATAIKVNIEKTISLKPDLVVATGLISPETIDLLRKTGLRVQVFFTPASFEGLCEQFIEIGELTGRSEKADQIVEQAGLRVEQIISEHKAQDKKVFFQIGADPVFSVLPDTFMDDYISMIGGVNIAGDMTRGVISRESVISRNPDVIFIVTMGITGEEEKSSWMNFGDMSAAKSESVYIIDAEKACTPTPITFVETLDTIFNLMKYKDEQ
jgi:iron complex transport system substrate-binding protein